MKLVEVSSTVAMPAEAQWVEAELVRSLMTTARNTRFIGLVFIPIFLSLSWDGATPGVLSLWTVVVLTAVCLRLAIMRKYAREVMNRGAVDQLAFFARYRILWPVNALAWGLSTLLYFDRSLLSDQFICWLVMAGLAMFSINTLSSHLSTLRSYLDVLALTLLAVILWRVGVQQRFQGPYYHYWIIVLLVLFWQVLRQAGLRLHMTHRKNFELQYRNNQLIELLTRQTQAALDAVETKNRFLASAAHDIRQPVHALGLYADWLCAEPDLVCKITPKIVESTKAVNALFDSLFDLVRLDSGKVKLNIASVDLEKLLLDLELQYRPLAQAKGLELRMRLTPGSVVSDPILLRRIVGNLICNAIKYTEHGGVLVATRACDSGRRIEIWDTGRGIAAAHQCEIFREFYKVPGHSGTEDGFGLGLYIVARLTGILEHPLKLASRLGRGTVFRVMIKPTDAREAADRAAASVDQLASMP